MVVGDAYVFPGFLTPVLSQLFFPKSPTTFLTCFCRGERCERGTHTREAGILTQLCAFFVSVKVPVGVS